MINKCKGLRLNRLNDSEAFIDYSSYMNNIHKNIEEYNSDEKREILIVFADMIADMLSNKIRNLLVTELFIIGKRLNISFVFITQSYHS